MIIELYGEAHELIGEFRIYGTAEELLQLSEQLRNGTRNKPLVDPGWIEVNPARKNHIVKAKAQDPKTKPWVR